MKKSAVIILISLIPSIMISSCNPSPQATVVPRGSPSAPAMPFPITSPVLTPDKTNINYRFFITDCDYIEKQIVEMSDSTIILQPTAYFPMEPAFILSVPSLIRTELPLTREGYSVYAISKKKDKIAYLTGNTKETQLLVVTNIKG